MRHVYLFCCNHRCKDENTPILEELIELRQRVRYSSKDSTLFNLFSNSETQDNCSPRYFILTFAIMSQKADLLGFPTHSSFVLDMRMAKSPERVAKFLTELKNKLQELKKEEMDLFLSYKKEDVRALL